MGRAGPTVASRAPVPGRGRAPSVIVGAASSQGSCKVSVTRPDLRLWRPAAEVERPEAPLRLHLQGEHLTRAQVRATCGRSLDATAPVSAPDRSLITPASEQVNCLS